MNPLPPQSVLDPVGDQALRIHEYFLLQTGTVVVVWLVVMAMLAYALVRGRRRSEPALDPASTRRAGIAVAAAIAATVVILVGLLITDLFTGRDLNAMTEEQPAVTIELVGSQWWWEARYEHATPSMRVTTANELHVPVGLPVLIRLESTDVIHSFWVPSLNGKQDLTPGYTNTIWLRVDSAGVYRGQCAEYCGHQHAHMALRVIAHEPADYEAWLAAQRASAREPSNSLQARGRDVFLASACVMCHTIRGTPAAGRVGPELTHVGSRQTIAAGTLPNDVENLARWIDDPQAIKPGVRMPEVPLAAVDVRAIAAYLESLK